MSLGALFNFMNTFNNNIHEYTNTSMSQIKIEHNKWQKTNNNIKTLIIEYNVNGDAISNISFIFNCLKSSFPVEYIKILIGGCDIIKYNKNVLLNSDIFNTYEHNNKLYLDIYFPIELLAIYFQNIKIEISIPEEHSFDTYIKYLYYNTTERGSLISKSFTRKINQYSYLETTINFNNNNNDNIEYLLNTSCKLNKMWIEIPENYKSKISLTLKLNNIDYTVIDDFTSWQTYMLSNKQNNLKYWYFIPLLNINTFVPNTSNIHLQTYNENLNQIIDLSIINQMSFKFNWIDNNTDIPSENIPISITISHWNILSYESGIASLNYLFGDIGWNLNKKINELKYNNIEKEYIGIKEPPKTRFCYISFEDLKTETKYDLCITCQNIVNSEYMNEWLNKNNICPNCRSVINKRIIGIIP